MKHTELVSIIQPTLQQSNPQKSSRHRILVVDDDHKVRQSKVKMLTDLGYDVEDAKDGADGWEALQNKHYDLVITDNTMPRMTGVEMIEKLRSAKMIVPVIMATGFMPIFEFERKPWLKPDVALMIPFPDEQLLVAIKRILTQK